MHKYTAVLLSVLLTVSILAGCGTAAIQPEPPAPAPETTIPAVSVPATEPEVTEATDSTTESTEPTASISESTAATEPASTETPTVLPEPEPPIPYTLPLHGFVSIFDSPSYDGIYVQAVGQDGVYTIVEEQTDAEGNLWGKLKSGVGWVCLTELKTDFPVLAGLADEEFLEQPHHLVVVDDSEYMVYLVFQPTETLTDVRLISLLPEIGGYTEDFAYDSLPALTPEKPLVAEVVFYGDFTTYGLSFLDESGARRYFAVYISGRNGAPVLQEYTP